MQWLASDVDVDVDDLQIPSVHGRDRVPLRHRNAGVLDRYVNNWQIDS